MILSPRYKTQTGPLILVVGPSGSGKDSLIALAREALRHETQFVFARRVITREALASAEEHDTLTAEQFHSAEAKGEFALHWQAHGLSYGIRRDIINSLNMGQSVIVNVSRSVINSAEGLGFPVVVISILCRPEILAERIAARGREPHADIMTRLKRDAPINVTTAKLVEIRNETSLEEASARFISVIREV